MFRSPAWAAKSCQTLLASWAQMRHGFTLQARQSALYLGLVKTPPGFVEPNPEFYSRLAGLAERATAVFESRGVFAPAPRLRAEQLRSDADFLDSRHLDQPDAPARIAQLSADDSVRLRKLLYALERLPDYLPGWQGFSPPPAATPAEFQAFYHSLIAALRAAASRYESGGPPSPEENLTRRRWAILSQHLRRLEALAHKQLRKLPHNASEYTFLKEYGENLAFIMGYLGNSWLSPVDDAPRWTEILRNPSRDELLAAGVGRPRTLFILYPWDGIEILCVGSVMPYYEYRTRERLTDQEWLRLVRSDRAPPLPGWISPYLHPDPLD